MAQKASRSWFGLLMTVVMFLLVLVLLVVATGNLAGGASEEGLVATRQAVERATVLCYATEGIYPPSLAYIEEHYGVQIDRSRYAVRYDAFASNQMPTIVVSSW